MTPAPRIALGRAAQEFERRWQRRGMPCLVPKCNERAIQSHSQQRNGQLSAIAENGHVYALERQSSRTFFNSSATPAALVRTGIGSASTFPGFCSAHDTTLFECIETRSVRPCDPQQVAALYLRAIAFESMQKFRGAELHKFMLYESGLNIPEGGRRYLEDALEGLRIAVERDTPYYLTLAFEVLQEPSLDYLTGVWATINECLPVSTTCCFSPLGENHDAYMIEHFDRPQPIMTCSIMPQSETSHIALVWPKETDALCAWVRPKLEQSPEEFLNHAALSESEDTCIRCSLWESLGPEDQGNILDAMRNELYRGKLHSPIRAFTVVGNVSVQVCA